MVQADLMFDCLLIHNILEIMNLAAVYLLIMNQSILSLLGLSYVVALHDRFLQFHREPVFILRIEFIPDVPTCAVYLYVSSGCLH